MHFTPLLPFFFLASVGLAAPVAQADVQHGDALARRDEVLVHPRWSCGTGGKGCGLEVPESAEETQEKRYINLDPEKPKDPKTIGKRVISLLDPKLPKDPKAVEAQEKRWSCGTGGKGCGLKGSEPEEGQEKRDVVVLEPGRPKDPKAVEPQEKRWSSGTGGKSGLKDSRRQ